MVSLMRKAKSHTRNPILPDLVKIDECSKAVGRIHIFSLRIDPAFEIVECEEHSGQPCDFLPPPIAKY